MYESLKDGRLECMFYQNKEYRLIFFSLSFDCIRYERFKFVAFGYVARSETCDCVHGPVRNVDLSVLGIHTLVVALFVCGGRIGMGAVSGHWIRGQLAWTPYPKMEPRSRPVD